MSQRCRDDSFGSGPRVQHPGGREQPQAATMDAQGAHRRAGVHGGVGVALRLRRKPWPSLDGCPSDGPCAVRGTGRRHGVDGAADVLLHLPHGRPPSRSVWKCLLVGDVGAVLVLTLLVHQSHAFGQAGAPSRVTCRRFGKQRNSAQVSPSRLSARRPVSQHRLCCSTTIKQGRGRRRFVRGHLLGARPCDLIEDGSKVAACWRRRETSAPTARHWESAGRAPAAVTPRDGQADAFGLSRGRETGQAITVKDQLAGVGAAGRRRRRGRGRVRPEGRRGGAGRRRPRRPAGHERVAV